MILPQHVLDRLDYYEVQPQRHSGRVGNYAGRVYQLHESVITLHWKPEEVSYWWFWTRLKIPPPRKIVIHCERDVNSDDVLIEGIHPEAKQLLAQLEDWASDDDLPGRAEQAIDDLLNGD